MTVRRGWYKSLTQIQHLNNVNKFMSLPVCLPKLVIIVRRGWYKKPNSGLTP